MIIFRIISVVVLVLTVFGGICVGSSVTCRVVSVSDGDSLVVTDRTEKQYNVRLYGVDAPASEQASGDNAHKMLSAMIANKDVTIQVVGVDSEGLANVKVYLGGACVNAAMVKSGYAWVQPELCKEAVCSQWNQYQQFASAKKIGLWQNPEAEPPWVYQKRRDKHDHTYTSAASHRRVAAGYRRVSSKRAQKATTRTGRT